MEPSTYNRGGAVMALTTAEALCPGGAPLRSIASPVVIAAEVPLAINSLRAFFRHHGLWAPGVRLFRALGFRAKAGIIALTFLLPLAVLGWNYFSSQAGQIAFSAKERLGVAYAREAMPVLALLERRRLRLARAAGSAPMAELDAALRLRLDKLAQVEKAHGPDLGTAQAYAVFLSALRAAEQAGPGGEAALQAQSACIQALIDLMGVSTDGSNLTLDPDIDTYYLMDASMFRLPVMVQAAGRLRAEGAAMLAEASAPPSRTRRAIEQLALLSGHDEAIQVGVAKAVAYNADVARLMDAGPAHAAVRGLAGGLEATVLHPEGLRGDPVAYTALADKALDEMVALTSQASTALDSLIAARVDRLSAVRDAIAVVTVLSLMAALYLFMSFRKVLDGGLRAVAFHINAMRDGDLTTQPHAWGADEAATLMHTLAEMQGALRRIVGQVRRASDSIVSASTQIASGADDLSARTERSAASLEETASAMTQISATVRRNEATADAATRLAATNAQAAERGGAIIGEVVRTMQEINGSSSRIGEIIGTIEGIAFQTNILALNAAVEAARAGEQGRGFSVVASEVRALAQRASAAAGEIKTLITASVDQVEGGVHVVREAGDTIGELVAGVRRVREMLSEVATHAREQATGVRQSAEAVQHLDNATQQNAALVEHTAAAAGTLKGQAQGLADEVARFRLPACHA